MLQPQYIDRCSQPDRLSWQGVIDPLLPAINAAAAITDTVLARRNRLLNRSARIEGLGYAVKCDGFSGQSYPRAIFAQRAGRLHRVRRMHRAGPCPD